MHDQQRQNQGDTHTDFRCDFRLVGTHVRTQKAER